jgi:6-phosphogluconolactonase
MNRQDLVVKPEVKYFSNLEALSQEAADFIAQRVRDRVAESGMFTLVLSGGSTPRRLYEILSQPPFLSEMPWPRIHFFWGDERVIPSTHPESNYNLANQNLLSKIQLSKNNIHRIPAEKGQGPWAAGEYEREILAFFNSIHPDTIKAPFVASVPQNPPNTPLIKGTAGGLNQEKSRITSFDLILLGLGKDGHTASLFPGDPALMEKEHLTAYVPKPGLPPDIPRITLTLPIINQAKEVLFLVSGREKKEIIRTILEDPLTAQDRFPAARVRPRGRLSWFIA